MDFTTGGLIAVFALAVAADLVTLLTVAVNREHQQQLRKLPRTALVILGLAFLGISIVSGRALFENSRRKPAEGNRGQSPENTGMTPQPASTNTDGGATASSPSPLPSSIVAPAVSPQIVGATKRRDEITVAEQDKALPDVVAAADESLVILRSSLYIVRGNLRSSQSQPDPGLQGLVTTNLTLDVTLVDSRGRVHEAFTLTSRGGGFTNDSSALQARERLREVLREHLQKEHS